MDTESSALAGTALPDHHGMTSACGCGHVHRDTLRYRGLELADDQPPFEYGDINVLEHWEISTNPGDLSLNGLACHIMLTNVRAAPNDDRVVYLVTSCRDDIVIGSFLATPWEADARVEQLALLTLATCDPATRQRVYQQHAAIASTTEG